jgi:hypothetical protein
MKNYVFWEPVLKMPLSRLHKLVADELKRTISSKFHETTMVRFFEEFPFECKKANCSIAKPDWIHIVICPDMGEL